MVFYNGSENLQTATLKHLLVLPQINYHLNSDLLAHQYAGIITPSAATRQSASHPVLGVSQETTTPASSGDKRHWVIPYP